MVTFPRDGSWGTTYYKIYFDNQTLKTFHYDLSSLLSNLSVDKWTVGGPHGEIPPNKTTKVNFDVDLRGHIGRRNCPVIFNDSSFNDACFAIKWGGDGGDQYITCLSNGGWKVERDTEEYNIISNQGHEIRVDGGGHERSTLNIFFHIKDKRSLRRVLAEAQGGPKNIPSYKKLYSVGWLPYLADWYRYVKNRGKIFTYYNPAEIDGVGVLLGVYDGNLWGADLKKRQCVRLPTYERDKGHYSWILSGDAGTGLVYKWNSLLDLRAKNYTRHSDLNRGEPVVCAGEFYISKRGSFFLEELFIELNDQSGHYKPDGKQCFKYVLEKFQDLGIDTSRVAVFARNP